MPLQNVLDFLIAISILVGSIYGLFKFIEEKKYQLKLKREKALDNKLSALNEEIKKLAINTKRNEYLIYMALFNDKEEINAMEFSIVKDIFNNYKKMGGNSYIDLKHEEMQKKYEKWRKNENK